MRARASFQRAGSRRRNAFTLIELLIVVAIIAILAAIAVPNFLEAQVRSKVATAKANMRTISVAVEAYMVDNNHPPLRTNAAVGDQDNRGSLTWFTTLSTPIAYLTTLAILDPFAPSKARVFTIEGDPRFGETPYYIFANIERYREFESPGRGQKGAPVKYCTESLGPDFVRGPRPDGSPGLNIDYVTDPFVPGDIWLAAFQYDATNGTRSAGDIIRWP